MSSDVGLTSALRSTIASLQNAKGNDSSQRANTSSSPTSTDTSSSVISPQSLSTRANELQGVLDGINQSVRTLEVASNAAAQLSALLQESEQFVSNVLNNLQSTNTPPEVFSVLNQNVAEVLTRIDEIVGEAAYKGTNLLKGDSIETSFNAGRPVVTTGIDVSTKGLDLPPPPITSIDGVQDFIAGIAAAQTDVTELQQFVNEDLSLVQTRRDFASESVAALSGGELTIYDPDEEAANLLALQTRQSLSSSDFSLAGENQRSLFKLF